MSDVLLSIRGVSKTFGRFRALNNVSLDVKHGEFIAMLGPSGCGKTTLLRTIAGFMVPDSGSITIVNNDVTSEPPNRRPLNTVFQNYALFPHMRVVENVAYGPRRQGATRAQGRERAMDALEMVGLATFAERYPQELSGGQQQRVALARALVNRPKLLLLDEPLSALDLKLRKRMQLELKHLQEKLGIAFVFVTHDQEEAMAMADRIVVMNAGNIEQIGANKDVYHNPATHFVADFIGEANFIPCIVRPDGRLQTSIGVLIFEAPSSGAASQHVAMVRPEHIRVQFEGQQSSSQISAVVEDVIDIGVHTTVILSVEGASLTARIAPDAKKPVRNQPVFLSFDASHIRILAE